MGSIQIIYEGSILDDRRGLAPANIFKTKFNHEMVVVIK